MAALCLLREGRAYGRIEKGRSCWGCRVEKKAGGATVSISLSRRPLPALFSRPGLCCWERAVLIYPEARGRFPPPGPLAAKPP